MSKTKSNYSSSEVKRRREVGGRQFSTNRSNNNSLVITDLHAETIDGKKILHGVNLTIHKGEIHAIMGPNGSGKTTLSQVLMGHPGYKITRGSIKLKGEDITAMSPDQRAKLGLFLGFQYPVEVPGVSFSNFLRMAVNEKRKGYGEKSVSPIAFRKEIAKKVDDLSLPKDFDTRSLNEGFSGGEKKKAEMLQLSMLRPEFAILDEPDSGLDVDALRYIAKAVEELDYEFGLLVITHYQRILQHITPDYVHVLINGKVALSGDAALAKKIETDGYEKYLSECHCERNAMESSQ